MRDITLDEGVSSYLACGETALPLRDAGGAAAACHGGIATATTTANDEEQGAARRDIWREGARATANA